MFYTLTTAIEAVEDILAECESGDISENLVQNETINALRQALFALQNDEAIEAQDAERFENREGDPAFNGAFNRW
jgi:FKBP-type peptidyl-prolyl cis-trans isomerase (trigger factor)